MKTASSAVDEKLSQAFAKHQAGDLRAAEKDYRDILFKNPNHHETTRLFSELLIDTGRAKHAIAVLRRLPDDHPNHFSTRYSLGNAYRLVGRHQDAIVNYQAAIAGNADFSGAHHGLGIAQRAIGDYGAAAEGFAAAARLNPKWPAAWFDLGMALATLGRISMAVAALENALTLDPSLAEARRHLLSLRETSASNDIPTLYEILRNQALPLAAKIETAFTLGKLLDKTERFDDAFQLFTIANQYLRNSLAGQGLHFNRERLTTDVNKLIATFTGAQLSNAALASSNSSLPVFIVGMPRSGTTLVEQIAASHPEVYGAGEMKTIGGIANKIGWAPSPSWSQTALQEATKTYLDALSARSGAALRVIDKLPDNIFQLGLIAHLFTNARIIFCERDPMDTCFSCFMQRFAEPHGFDTDLADCGFRHREVDRLTRHWQTVLPLPMLRISYEALVTNPEAQSRKLIDFLGLKWDPTCLDFHRTERAVTTASWFQVRQPMYSHSIGRTKHYARHLAPLIASLTGKVDLT